MYICKEVPDDFFNTGKVFMGPTATNGSSAVSFPHVPPEEALGLQWDGSTIIKTLIFTAITLCTIGGNGMVLLAMIFRRNNLKSSTHYFIASLSLADFLVGILVMPFLTVLSVTGKWYFGRGYCIAFHCIHYWLCAASILSITAICVERFIGVRYPLKHFKFMSGQRVMQGCGIVWTVAGFLSVGPLFITPEPFPMDDPYACPVNFQVFHVVVVMIFMFYVPCAIMLGLYLRIYCIASAHLEAISERRRKTHGMTGMSASDSGIDGPSRKKNGKEKSTASTNITSSSSSGAELNSADSTEALDDRKRIKEVDETLLSNRKKQTSLSKKLFLVVGAFFICYFPFFTTFMIRSIESSLVSDQLFTALGWIRYFNSCLNPMIYAAMLKPFRNAFKDIIHLVPCQRK